MKLAVYPGSFDPLTNGHVDIIERGTHLFDKIVVAILVNVDKSPLFSMQERVDIVREVFKGRPNVEVDTFDGLLVDYVAKRNADVIVRGLRALSDFETEFQMALMNRRLNPDIETVFMMPAEQYTNEQGLHIADHEGRGRGGKTEAAGCRRRGLRRGRT
jgi:pantetheine-phosphate adenylyltransferase